MGTVANQDYTYQSVYLAYFMFAILVGLAAYFLYRSSRDGYWGKQSEDPKFHVFDQDELTRGGN